MSFALAAFLKPFVYFVLFVLVVAPITWVLWRLIPDGRFKVFLFRVRDGDGTGGRDKVTMALAVILSYGLLFALVAYLYR